MTRRISPLPECWRRDEANLPLGILYHNPDAPRYDMMSAVGLEMSADEKLAGMNKALDNFAI